MAHFFFQDDREEWSCRELTQAMYRVVPAQGSAALTSTRLIPVDAAEVVVDEAIVVKLTEVSRLAAGVGVAPDLVSFSGDSNWIALAPPQTRLRINGLGVSVGAAALRDRDEVSLPGSAPFYFSMERLMRIDPYRSQDAPRCPRCTLPIERGDASVCCPTCSVWHHECADRGCWTYAPTCALCDQTSDLENGYRWTPEEL